jgi:hypothetical protein
MKVLSALFVFLLCSGCRSWRDHRQHAQFERFRAEALAKIDQPACFARGGHIEYVGMDGMPACAVPFADAGKLCSDTSECLGKCLVEITTTMDVGSTGIGHCQRVDIAPTGCWSEVQGGKILQALCAD